MAICERLNDFRAMHAGIKGDIINLNRLHFFNKSDLTVATGNLKTEYNTDTISMVPSCDCGEVKYGYNIGMRCPHCHTMVTEQHVKTEPRMWMYSINSNLPFINPMFWIMFDGVISSSDSWLYYLCSNKSTPKGKIPPYVHGVVVDVLNGVRTYASLIANLQTILEYLIINPAIIKNKKDYPLSILLNVLCSTPELVFTPMLPMVNKKLFVQEDTTSGKYTNIETVAGVTDTVLSWIAGCNKIYPIIDNQDNSEADIRRADRAIDGLMSSTLNKLGEFYNIYIVDYLHGKPGLFRKHVYGARSHHTFRAVITPISGPHKYTELHVPMTIGLVVYRPAVMNKLVIKYGYTIKEATSMLNVGIKQYIPLLYAILCELIDESPEKQLPVIAQRNPSQFQGSALALGITLFKKDLYDYTVSISAKVIKYPNGDYDGDELNFTAGLDNLMGYEMKTLAPHFNIVGYDKPYTLSSNFTIGGPAHATMCNALSDVTEYRELDTVISRLQAHVVEINTTEYGV